MIDVLRTYHFFSFHSTLLAETDVAAFGDFCGEEEKGWKATCWILSSKIWGACLGTSTLQNPPRSSERLQGPEGLVIDIYALINSSEALEGLAKKNQLPEHTTLTSVSSYLAECCTASKVLVGG